MKQRYLFLAIFCFLTVGLLAQKNKANSSKLGIAAAFDYAVVNNVKEVRGTYKPGINARLVYSSRSFFALSGEFTHHIKHDAAPALENIYSWNADINGHFILDVGESDLKFAAIFGVGLLDWRGTYVGPSLNDNKTYYYGLLLKDRWVAANMGFGFNHDFGKRFNGFGEFKVRMTSQSKDDLIGVRDATFNFGLRFNFLEIQKPEKNTDLKNANPKDNKNAGKKKPARNKYKPGRQYKWLPK